MGFGQNYDPPPLHSCQSAPLEIFPQAHPALSALTLQLLAKEPDHRPPNALEVALELDRIGRGVLADEHQRQGAGTHTVETPRARSSQRAVAPRPTRLQGSRRRQPVPAQTMSFATLPAPCAKRTGELRGRM